MSKNKSLLLFSGFLGLLVWLSSCNKERFVNQLVGSWKVNYYFFEDLNKTREFDSAYHNYVLKISENNSYSENWIYYRYTTRTQRDTVYLDSVNYTVNIIQIRDSVPKNVYTTGRWDLINSDENFQIRDDSTNEVRIFRFIEKSKSKMKLRLGQEEYQMEKI